MAGRRDDRSGSTYDWPPASTYVQNPPYFQGITMETKSIENIEGARVMAILGDMITTDHISPGGVLQGHHACGPST